MTSKRVERLAPGLAEGEMIADLVAHGQLLHRRDQLLAAQRELVRRVVGNAVAALLRLQQQRKGRIAADVDARDGVHLDGDIQFHGGVRLRREHSVKRSGSGCVRNASNTGSSAGVECR